MQTKRFRRGAWNNNVMWVGTFRIDPHSEVIVSVGQTMVVISLSVWLCFFHFLSFLLHEHLFYYTARVLIKYFFPSPNNNYLPTPLYPLLVGWMQIPTVNNRGWILMREGRYRKNSVQVKRMKIRLHTKHIKRHVVHAGMTSRNSCC